MHVKNTTDESTTPASERFPIFALRYQAHNPAAGKNDKREVLFSAMTPHSRPNSIHGRNPSRSTSVRVNQITVANSRADRLVSQIQRVHQNITFGSSAQAHADPSATFSEKMRREILKIGTQVKAEHALLNVSNTNAEALE